MADLQPKKVVCDPDAPLYDRTKNVGSVTLPPAAAGPDPVRAAVGAGVQLELSNRADAAERKKQREAQEHQIAKPFRIYNPEHTPDKRVVTRHGGPGSLRTETALGLTGQVTLATTSRTAEKVVTLAQDARTTFETTRVINPERAAKAAIATAEDSKKQDANMPLLGRAAASMPSPVQLLNKFWLINYYVTTPPTTMFEALEKNREKYRKEAAAHLAIKGKSMISLRASDERAELARAAFREADALSDGGQTKEAYTQFNKAILMFVQSINMLNAEVDVSNEFEEYNRALKEADKSLADAMRNLDTMEATGKAVPKILVVVGATAVTIKTMGAGAPTLVLAIKAFGAGTAVSLAGSTAINFGEYGGKRLFGPTVEDDAFKNALKGTALDALDGVLYSLGAVAGALWLSWLGKSATAARTVVSVNGADATINTVGLGAKTLQALRPVTDYGRVMHQSLIMESIPAAFQTTMEATQHPEQMNLRMAVGEFMGRLMLSWAGGVIGHQGAAFRRAASQALTLGGSLSRGYRGVTSFVGEAIMITAANDAHLKLTSLAKNGKLPEEFDHAQMIVTSVVGHTAGRALAEKQVRDVRHARQAVQTVSRNLVTKNQVLANNDFSSVALDAVAASAPKKHVPARTTAGRTVIAVDTGPINETVATTEAGEARAHSDYVRANDQHMGGMLEQVVAGWAQRRATTAIDQAYGGRRPPRVDRFNDALVAEMGDDILRHEGLPDAADERAAALLRSSEEALAGTDAFVRQFDNGIRNFHSQPKIAPPNWLSRAWGAIEGPVSTASRSVGLPVAGQAVAGVVKPALAFAQSSALPVAASIWLAVGAANFFGGARTAGFRLVRGFFQVVFDFSCPEAAGIALSRSAGLQSRRILLEDVRSRLTDPDLITRVDRRITDLDGMQQRLDTVYENASNRGQWGTRWLALTRDAFVRNTWHRLGAFVFRYDLPPASTWADRAVLRDPDGNLNAYLRQVQVDASLHASRFDFTREVSALRSSLLDHVEGASNIDSFSRELSALSRLNTTARTDICTELRQRVAVQTEQVRTDLQATTRDIDALASRIVALQEAPDPSTPLAEIESQVRADYDAAPAPARPDVQSQRIIVGWTRRADGSQCSQKAEAALKQVLAEAGAADPAARCEEILRSPDGRIPELAALGRRTDAAAVAALRQFVCTSRTIDYSFGRTGSRYYNLTRMNQTLADGPRLDALFSSPDAAAPADIALNEAICAAQSDACVAAYGRMPDGRGGWIMVTGTMDPAGWRRFNNIVAALDASLTPERRDWALTRMRNALTGQADTLADGTTRPSTLRREAAARAQHAARSARPLTPLPPDNPVIQEMVRRLDLVIGIGAQLSNLATSTDPRITARSIGAAIQRLDGILSPQRQAQFAQWLRGNATSTAEDVQVMVHDLMGSHTGDIPALAALTGRTRRARQELTRAVRSAWEGARRRAGRSGDDLYDPGREPDVVDAAVREQVQRLLEGKQPKPVLGETFTAVEQARIETLAAEARSCLDALRAPLRELMPKPDWTRTKTHEASINKTLEQLLNADGEHELFQLDNLVKDARSNPDAITREERSRDARRVIGQIVTDDYLRDMSGRIVAEGPSACRELQSFVEEATAGGPEAREARAVVERVLTDLRASVTVDRFLAGDTCPELSALAADAGSATASVSGPAVNRLRRVVTDLSLARAIRRPLGTAQDLIPHDYTLAIAAELSGGSLDGFPELQSVIRQANDLSNPQAAARARTTLTGLLTRIRAGISVDQLLAGNNCRELTDLAVAALSPDQSISGPAVRDLSWVVRGLRVRGEMNGPALIPADFVRLVLQARTEAAGATGPGPVRGALRWLRGPLPGKNEGPAVQALRNVVRQIIPASENPEKRVRALLQDDPINFPELAQAADAASSAVEPKTRRDAKRIITQFAGELINANRDAARAAAPRLEDFRQNELPGLIARAAASTANPPSLFDFLPGRYSPRFTPSSDLIGVPEATDTARAVRAGRAAACSELKAAVTLARSGDPAVAEPARRMLRGVLERLGAPETENALADLIAANGDRCPSLEAAARNCFQPDARVRNPSVQLMRGVLSDLNALLATTAAEHTLVRHIDDLIVVARQEAEAAARATGARPATEAVRELLRSMLPEDAATRRLAELLDPRRTGDFPEIMELIAAARSSADPAVRTRTQNALGAVTAAVVSCRRTLPPATPMSAADNLLFTFLENGMTASATGGSPSPFAFLRAYSPSGGVIMPVAPRLAAGLDFLEAEGCGQLRGGGISDISRDLRNTFDSSPRATPRPVNWPREQAYLRAPVFSVLPLIPLERRMYMQNHPEEQTDPHGPREMGDDRVDIE